MFYICNLNMFASKNHERRYDQGRKEFVSHYPQVLEQPWMQQINFFLQTIYWR